MSAPHKNRWTFIDAVVVLLLAIVLIWTLPRIFGCAALSAKTTQSIDKVVTSQPVEVQQALVALKSQLDAQITGIRYTSYGGLGAYSLILLQFIERWRRRSNHRNLDKRDDDQQLLLNSHETRLLRLEGTATNG